MKPTRSETLALLSSLGVEIPPDSKIQDGALASKLKKALNLAQRLSEVMPRGTFDPAIAPPWTASKELLQDIMGTHSIEEHMQRAEHQRGQAGVPDPLAQPFVGMRQSLRAVGKAWDDSKYAVTLQDEAQTSVILLRIVSAYKIDASTPALVILYQVAGRADPRAAVGWIQERFDGRGVVSITSSLEEQRLLRALLTQNAVLLPAGMPVERHSSERKFMASLLLPIRPLDQEDRGKLTATTGCHACGRNSKLSRCSSCQMVEYCSKECQRGDWTAHKAMCKSIQGGTWHAIEMTMMPAFAEGLGLHVSTALNRTADFGRASRTKDLSTVTPGANIHGDRPFLVKFQTLISGEGGNNSHMMMYDRQRSFQTYFLRRSAPAVFDSFVKESLERGGYEGLKMYRYVKRVADTSLSVCLDRQPKDNITW